MNSHNPQWAYFAMLRPQNHSLSWVRESIRKDGGRNAPTEQEVAKYCQAHNLRQPKSYWWQDND